MFFSLLNLSCLEPVKHLRRRPIERFSSFLRDTDNLWFQKIRESPVKKLIHFQIIKGDYLSLDACPIKAKVKQNNLKTNMRYRFCKENPPRNDPESRLGVLAIFPSGKKKVEFFFRIPQPYYK